MVGDDNATAAFKRYWESPSRPPGSKLVFSTGRSLPLFESLCEEKASILPTPDMLCLAVGTRIFTRTAGGAWAEDATWTRSLDESWNSEFVREVAAGVVAALGSDSAHFLSEAEQNRHKISLGLRTEVVAAVEAEINGRLDQAGLTAKVREVGGRAGRVRRRAREIGRAHV